MSPLPPSSRSQNSLQRQSAQDVLPKVSERRSEALSAQPINQLGVLYIVLSAAGFGSLGIFGKLAYAQGFTVLSTLCWRVAGGAITLWIWMLLSRQWRMRRSHLQQALILGAVGYTLPTGLFFGALMYTSASVTALMFYTYPAFVAIGYWATRRTPLKRLHILALGLTFAGCLSTVNWAQADVQPLGIILGIAAGCSYGIYLLLSARMVHQASPVPTAGYMLLGAAIAALGIALSQQALHWPTTLAQGGVVFGLAVVATAFPIVLLYSGLKRLDVVPASILSTLEPVLAVLMGFFLLGESLWIGQLIGGFLILSAALLLQLKST